MLAMLPNKHKFQHKAKDNSFNTQTHNNTHTHRPTHTWTQLPGCCAREGASERARERERMSPMMKESAREHAESALIFGRLLRLSCAPKVPLRYLLEAFQLQSRTRFGNVR